MNNNPRRNGEGYYDPTAYGGLENVIREEKETDRLCNRVMQSFRLLTELAGFEVVGRVTLRHKKSGRIFK